MKVLVFCAAAAAFLAPSTSYAVPMDCSSGSLASYLGLTEGCLIGSSIFSDFETFAVPGVTDLDPGSITVTPIGGLYNPGFLFSGPFSADTGDLLGLGVAYAAQGRFVGAEAELVGATATEDAVITLIKDICIGDTFVPGFCSASFDNITLFAADFDAETAGSIVFAATSAIGVRDELVVDGGLDGTASLTSIRNQFSAVPEPSAFLLLGLGIMALAASRSRTRPH